MSQGLQYAHRFAESAWKRKKKVVVGNDVKLHNSRVGRMVSLKNSLQPMNDWGSIISRYAQLFPKQTFRLSIYTNHKEGLCWRSWKNITAWLY